MRIPTLRHYSLSIAAALIALPTCMVSQAQTSSQPSTLYSTDAVLTHALNSTNAKMGQTVTAKLTDDVKTTGAMELPKGTLLLGKVDQVQDSSSNGGCTLSLVFDRAQIGKGHEIPIKATLLGAYPPPVYSYDGVASSMATQPSSISGDHTVDQGPGMLNGVSLASAVKSSVSGVFTSTNRSIKLRNGTRLQVAIAPMMSATGND